MVRRQWSDRGTAVATATALHVVVLLLIGLTVHRLPWRYVPGTDERYSGQDPGAARLDQARPALSQRPPAASPAAGAYAEIP